MSLTPPGSQVLRVAEDYGRQAWLAAGDGWTLRSVLWRAGSAEVTVTADDGEVTIGFWHRSERRGPIRSARPVSAEPWAGIRGNYASATARMTLADLYAHRTARPPITSEQPGRGIGLYL